MPPRTQGYVLEYQLARHERVFILVSLTDARLLIVDDNADNRDVLARRLARLGYANVAFAEDGVQAMAAIEAETFGAVLLDVMMPRMNGIEVLEALRARDRLVDLPVIMISAATEIDIVVRCIELGAEDYLPKPFNPVLLRARLGSVLEKKALRAELRAQLARLEREMAEARRQQLSMVPTEFPRPERTLTAEVHAAMYPAREVGGDLYDCFQANEDVLCFAVGDVSGKGMPAALFMARARSLLRASTLQFAATTGRVPLPSDLLAVVNAELCKNNPFCMFITLFLGFLDLHTGRLLFANAGHVRPFLLPANGVATEVACPPGMPLGVLETARHPDAELHFGRGDAMVVITDGLPEMMNETGDFYTLERVVADLNTQGDASAETLIGHLMAQVMGFNGTAEQSDDVTALAVRVV
jgi:sigma-B regulation protein RsbU (phosphoserine phosphatase)